MGKINRISLATWPKRIKWDLTQEYSCYESRGESNLKNTINRRNLGSRNAKAHNWSERRWHYIFWSLHKRTWGHDTGYVQSVFRNLHKWEDQQGFVVLRKKWCLRLSSFIGILCWPWLALNFTETPFHRQKGRRDTVNLTFRGWS